MELSRHAKYAQKIRQKRRELGLCNQCGKVPAQDGKQCSICKDFKLRWNKANPQAYKASASKFNRKRKFEVMKAYGGVCACCGESNLAFLTIDHINGGGNQHKTLTKRPIYQWLRTNNYPAGYQVLCFNCNCAKSINPACPHQLDKLI
ncbi:MAG: hypothetical protein NVS1B10_07330 [Candidatus Saccharimonadales bacterium]